MSARQDTGYAHQGIRALISYSSRLVSYYLTLSWPLAIILSRRDRTVFHFVINCILCGSFFLFHLGVAHAVWFIYLRDHGNLRQCIRYYREQMEVSSQAMPFGSHILSLILWIDEGFEEYSNPREVSNERSNAVPRESTGGTSELPDLANAGSTVITTAAEIHQTDEGNTSPLVNINMNRGSDEVTAVLRKKSSELVIVSNEKSTEVVPSEGPVTTGEGSVSANEGPVINLLPRMPPYANQLVIRRHSDPTKGYEMFLTHIARPNERRAVSFADLDRIPPTLDKRTTVPNENSGERTTPSNEELSEGTIVTEKSKEKSEKVRSCESLDGSNKDEIRSIGMATFLAQLTIERPVGSHERPPASDERAVPQDERPVPQEERPVLPDERLVAPDERPVLQDERPVSPNERPALLVVPAEEVIRARAVVDEGYDEDQDSLSGRSNGEVPPNERDALLNEDDALNNERSGEVPIVPDEILDEEPFNTNGRNTEGTLGLDEVLKLPKKSLDEVKKTNPDEVPTETFDNVPKESLSEVLEDSSNKVPEDSSSDDLVDVSRKQPIEVNATPREENEGKTGSDENTKKSSDTVAKESSDEGLATSREPSDEGLATSREPSDEGLATSREPSDEFSAARNEALNEEGSGSSDLRTDSEERPEKIIVPHERSDEH